MKKEKKNKSSNKNNEGKEIEIILKYKLKDYFENGIYILDGQIFGEDFVKKNKSKCSLYINNKKKKLSSFLDKYDQKKHILEMKLIIQQPLTYMQGMFYNSICLEKISDNFADLDTSNVTNMDDLFKQCESLSNLPDISKWNTSNVKNMQRLFF